MTRAFCPHLLRDRSFERAQGRLLSVNLILHPEVISQHCSCSSLWTEGWWKEIALGKGAWDHPLACLQLHPLMSYLVWFSLPAWPPEAFASVMSDVSLIFHIREFPHRFSQTAMVEWLRESSPLRSKGIKERFSASQGTFMWNNIVRLAIPEAIYRKQQDQVFVYLMKQYELQPRSLWSVICECTQKDLYLPCTNFQKPTARGFPLKWGSKPENKKIQETGIQHRGKVETMTNQDMIAGEQVWRFKNTPRTIWSRVCHG